MFFHEYPYTSFSELNLDYVLNAIKLLQEAMKDFEASNSLTWADPLTWDINTQYAKNTIVIDSMGNAYISLKAVSSGISLTDPLYWLQVFDFAGFVRRSNKNFTDHYEYDTVTASDNYTAGDWIVWNDVLYKALVNIYQNEELEIGVNLVHFTVEDFLKAFVTSIEQTVLQYKNDIDASELAYRNQLAYDISTTTDSLQAQLDEAISGATVDSEVINARVGADGVTYPTLGDAIRTQISNINLILSHSLPGDSITFTAGGFINTSGATVDPSNITSNAGWSYAVVNCEENDLFLINAQGTGSARAWTFIDASNNKLTQADSGAVSDTLIIAPATASKLILNTTVTPNCIKYISNTDLTVRVDVLESLVYDSMKKDEIIFTSGEFINTSGATINPSNTTTNASWSYAVLDCQPGDQFLINAQGTGGARAWTFIDASNNKLTQADSGAVTDTRITAPLTASKLILNSVTANLGYCAKYITGSTVSGRNRLIYRYGDNGNDWCFVYTPTDYDARRAKPYPMVICNHGNGWIMDGSVKKANYTARSMYLLATDPDYIDNPDIYTLTADPDLVGSSPTIEALLSAGYVVCGAENYGDNLYGNNDCRKACVNFYNHMLRTYNVKPDCYMIGASAGGLTCLNAAYLLQGNVRAIALQYAMTSIVNQYTDHSAHRSGIRDAYGITDPNISPVDLASAVRTHDPMTFNVVAGMKTDITPAVKTWYSLDDNTVPASANSIPFAQLLNNSMKVVSTVEVTGTHGDLSHFDPAGVVSWFNAN